MPGFQYFIYIYRLETPHRLYVANLEDFDRELSNYVKGPYVKQKYIDYLGCQGANLTDTDDYYARYTTSTICSGLVQSSINDCRLSAQQSRPLCADTCALMATSEGEIVINAALCPKKSSGYMSQIRSDFAICSGPADSLTGTCISGADNESTECGYGPNLIGLCGYCGASSPNSTDICCVNANVETRCKDVTLPTSTATLPPILTSTANSTAGTGTHHGLSGGQIAGIVVGSVVGAALLVALIILAFILRRRRRSQDYSALNKPNPQRKGSPSMQGNNHQPGAAFIPGGRVARMSALREAPSSSPARSRNSAAIFGGAKSSDTSDSEGYGASPGAMSKKIPPVTGRRHGSLSSNSALAGAYPDSSPRSGTNQYSSPEGITSGQSEQLSSFQDYYSQDDIQPGDKVAVLWAYQPRAGDEFALERGDMLKVIGIWDDGWATGIRVPETADDYDTRHREQRDSGVSNGSRRPATSPSPTGEIKAFPLVCVCLPQHWRKIIDGGENDEEGS
ncbi:SH3 domain protein [Aspergillus clavatus NRRL 1]|uniref:SH3 domain protein n=1 Tax=Aspergillus clavatus (strain ATCC 1007 / CBS 513.65 / DSM 816 / NCTC 3887 / NRRL 1 / QM 1276 / 107) TaxID=344612 RepID=A1CB04_ASPCL|nr:SH3 domain protein [Aspergillus clavatus NRRL 1]EAW12922.1 SH3 domain protein [Aspergillus clavatus NRRL 1]